MRSAAAALVALTSHAYGGGLLLPTHGMHSTERAGALVAGADDADALFLDPAGLARIAGDGQRSLLFDVGYLYEPEQYTAPNFGKLSNEQPGTEQFTIAGALGIGERLVIAGGVTTLPAGVHHFDNTGPQRYTSIDATGTQYVTVAIGAAYVLAPNLRIGATLTDTVSMLNWSLSANACTTAAECTGANDLAMHLTQNDYFAPSGSIGAQYDALSDVTIGVAIQGPTSISSTGTLEITPPASGGAITGSKATTSYWLAPSVRAGVEFHHANVKLEAAVEAELWGIHDAITIAPDGIALGTSQLQTMTINRDYHTSTAASLGGEVHFGEVRIAAGIGYESSAAPARTVTTFAIDAPKLLLGLGGGYSYEGWEIGAAAGLAQLATVNVTDPAVKILTPLSSTATVYANAGSYGAYDLTVGLRGSRRF